MPGRREEHGFGISVWPKATLKRVLGIDRLRAERDGIATALVAITSERDAAIAERDAYLQQRDIAIGERNELLRQRDIAIGECNEFLRQRDNAIGGLNACVQQISELRQRMRELPKHAIGFLISRINEAIEKPSEVFFAAVDYARLAYRDAVMGRDKLEDALFGVKLINLMIAKHEYLRGNVAATARPLGWMIDPANQCHLGCPSCTNSYNREFSERTYNQWPRGLMSPETFDTFARGVGVHAWNLHLYNNHEPLLNKLTPGFVRKATDLRIRTFISSNLSYRKIDAEAIVASGLTELMVAADGVTQETYERYRRGGQIEWVLDNARAIVEAKARMHSATPILRWQYLSFRHNVHEIERAAMLAQEIGFDTFNVATPHPVKQDDPTIETAEYGGRRDLQFRQRPKMPFTGSLEPYRKIIEEALGESASERWRQHGSAERVAGERCDWLSLAAISDAGGRIVPCCKGDVRNIGKFVFADMKDTNIMNTPTYQQARRIVAGAIEEQVPTVACTRCPVRPPPQVGLGAVKAYLADIPALSSADMSHLHDWSHHVTYRGA